MTAHSPFLTPQPQAVGPEEVGKTPPWPFLVRFQRTLSLGFGVGMGDCRERRLEFPELTETQAGSVGPNTEGAFWQV